MGRMEASERARRDAEMANSIGLVTSVPAPRVPAIWAPATQENSTMAEGIDPRWAWEPYRPTEQSPWDLRKVGHLFRRASFGATWTELKNGLKAGPEETKIGEHTS